MTREERSRRRFSEAFKREQVDLIERGVLRVAEVSRLYEVSATAVQKWLTKYGRRSKVEGVVIQKAGEIRRLDQLEEEKKELERLVGRQQVELVYLREVLEQIRAHYGEDVEKKFNWKSCGS